MKLHRFYASKAALVEGPVTIHSTELSHQLKNVLKLRPGEKALFFNGDGNEYHGEIVSYKGKEGIQVNIEAITLNEVSFGKELSLFFSLVKRDNVEWILEKGTEVGVSHFIPIISSRSEKKGMNMERAEKIVIEASEQCGRNKVPTIHPVTTLEDVLNDFDLSFIVLQKDKTSISENPVKDKRIGLLVGPEGGWTENEMELLEKKGVSFRSLGPTTLRAETAAVVGSATIIS